MQSIEALGVLQTVVNFNVKKIKKWKWKMEKENPKELLIMIIVHFPLHLTVERPQNIPESPFFSRAVRMIKYLGFGFA